MDPSMYMRRDDKMLLVLLFCLLIVACQENYFENKSEILIKSLRRKLTENNYDYSSSETGEVRMRAESRESPTSASTASSTIGQTHIFNKQYTKTLYLHDSLSTTGERQPRVFNNDLLYYIDDRHLLPEEAPVKYKLLKVKHKSRRSEGELIQEESKDGVAIINLGGGPIPEFRLPRSRRQYMHDHGQLTNEDEDLTPSLINSSLIIDQVDGSETK